MRARFPRRPSLTLVGAVALVIAMANPAAAPPGDLDPSFDADGKVTTNFAGSFDRAQDVAIQGDGRILAAGLTGIGTFPPPSGTANFALGRYNIDGSLDTIFDGDGMVTTDFAGGEDQVVEVGIQGDGKIVAAGFAGVSGTFDFALARYNTDGSLDTTFDTDGKVTTDFSGGNDQAHGVALQGDGKIVAAGFAGVSGTDDFALARYNTDGSLDTTFDTDGKVTTDLAGGTDQAFGLGIQGDGKIVTAGLASVSGNDDFALARYNTDGSLDTTFDTDGKMTTDFSGGDDQAFAMAIQGDGKIVAAGSTGVSGVFDFALARYNTGGSLDTTFDGDGMLTTDFAGNLDEAYAMAIQGDGKIVASGSTDVTGANDFALARYKTDGSLDTIFSGDGKVTTDFTGNNDVAFAVAIQANGRIVAAGRAEVSSGDHHFALARYTCFRRTSRPMSIPLCP